MTKNRPAVELINVDTELACLVSHEARLLWYSDKWVPEGRTNNPADFTGTRWLEWIHEDDLDSVLDFFASPVRLTIIYRYMNPWDREHSVMQLGKIAHGGDWFCIACPL